MEEVWKDIKGYEGLYQVSNYGRIKSLDRIIKDSHRSYNKNDKILKLSFNFQKYLMVNLSKYGVKKSYRVNRLVAEAFIPNPLNKSQVNHIDGNKINNNVENLEWVTPSENMQHAYKNGLINITDEYRELKSESSKGNNNPFYGKHHSDKTKNKISKANKGKMDGIKHPRCKKIICLTTGEIFDYMKQAECKYNIPKSNICKCCKFEIKSAGKHPITKEKMIWRYIE